MLDSNAASPARGGRFFCAAAQAMLFPAMPELVYPNWHVLFIHFPIGLLVVGVAVEVATMPLRRWRRGALRAAGRWMALLGALACIPAATTGIYAYRDVLAADTGVYWHELREDDGADITDPEALRLLRRHIWLASIATGGLMVWSVLAIGLSEQGRRRWYPLLLVGAAAACGTMMAGAHFGGTSVHAHGVGVADRPPKPPGDDVDLVKYVLPPVQLHLLLAGLTLSGACVALGLSIRRIGATPPPPGREMPLEPVDVELAARQLRQDKPEPRALSDLPEEPPLPAAPAGWLAAAGLALGAAAVGLWAAESLSWRSLSGLLEGPPRVYVHALSGGSIALLSILLAAASRWAPRSRILLVVLAILLAAAIAAAVWIGVLMLFDTKAGPLDGFNPPEP